MSNEPVVSWELGLRKVQHEVGLDGKGFYGFGVDTGTPFFTDVEAIPPWRARPRMSPSTRSGGFGCRRWPRRWVGVRWVAGGWG